MSNKDAAWEYFTYLEAEVERLKDEWLSPHDQAEWAAENAALKAEVERLREKAEEHGYMVLARDNELERLREENTRVGDYLAGALDERDRHHRIEEAARAFLADRSQGADTTALRAALEEK